MKLAATYENGEIFQHFGRTPAFKLFEIEENTVKNAEVIPANGEGHGTLAVQLKELGVDTVICGGLGMGMLNALEGMGIKVCANVSGSADEAVMAYLTGSLNYNTEAHACGGHGGHHEHHHEA